MSTPPPLPSSLSLESWLAPAKVLGSLVLIAAGAGMSWALLSAKAESAEKSAASANAAVQRLGESMGKWVDALEASTSARLASIEEGQRQEREARIRLEEQMRSMDARTARMDNRLEVLLDRTGPRTPHAAR